MAIALLFIGKLIASLVGVGFLAVACLWPINDQPTSKGQFVAFFLFAALFIGWMFNLYHLM